MTKMTTIYISTNHDKTHTACCPELGWVIPYDFDENFKPYLDNEIYLDASGIKNTNFIEEVAEGHWDPKHTIEISLPEAQLIGKKLEIIVKAFQEESAEIAKILKINE